MRLGAVNRSFLRMESTQTPMHTASLLIFRLPAGAPPDYLQQLFLYMRRLPFAASPPFCYRLRRGLFGRLVPRWEPVAKVDLDYHLRHSALPKPGGERELGIVISRLHSHPLDLSRPPWECHLVEGLDQDRFAVYLKIHRALADGPMVGELLDSLLWRAPEADADWTAQPLLAAPAPRAAPRWSERLRATLSLLQALGRVLHSALGRGARFPLPYSAPASMLNAPISGHRRYATQALPLARLRALAAAAQASIGEVFLCICGAALRRYLLERDALPSRSLLASVSEGLAASPVEEVQDLPDAQDAPEEASLIVELGTQIGDHRDRLHTIRQSLQAGREQLRVLHPLALPLYGKLLAAPRVLAQRLGLGARLKPYASLAINSTPGLGERRFFRGAPVEALYPAAVLFDGQGLALSVRRYGQDLDVGIVACRDALPGIQRLSIYLDTALGDVERAYGLRSR